MELSDITDFQAESGVIATLVHHPEFILHSEYLKANYFYEGDNKSIYWAISELYAKGVITIDAINITNMLNSNKAVKNLVAQYNLPSIQEFMDLCINAARNTVEEYLLLVNRVVELSFKRDFYKITLDFQKMCFDKSLGLNDMSNGVYKKISTLTQGYITTGDIVKIGDKVDVLYNNLVTRRNKNGTFGIPSKFKTLSSYFNYEPTELVLVKSRMKNGKSILAMNEALHKAKNGISTLIVDSEMSDDNFYVRLLAHLSGVKVIDLKNGNYSDKDNIKIDEANEIIKTLPLLHIYDPYMTNEKLYSICAEKKIELGLQFVIYDYIKGSGSSRDSSQLSNELGQKCDYLKNVIAGGLNLAVLAFCQLGRTGMVADSDALERFCSVSVMWQAKTDDQIIKDGKDCGNYLISVDLNRLGGQTNGDDEYIDMNFNGDKLLIQEAKQHTKQAHPFQ